MQNTSIAITVDVVCLRPAKQPTEVLLIRRAGPPFAGQWALPGGFVEADEGLEAAARRELEEETGLTPVTMQQLYCFDDPNRDPRGRTISIAYIAFVNPDQSCQAGDDAAEAAWFPLSVLPPLAFDHHKIISKALKNA